MWLTVFQLVAIAVVFMVFTPAFTGVVHEGMEYFGDGDCPAVSAAWLISVPALLIGVVTFFSPNDSFPAWYTLYGTAWFIVVAFVSAISYDNIGKSKKTDQPNQECETCM